MHIFVEIICSKLEGASFEIFCFVLQVLSKQEGLLTFGSEERYVRKLSCVCKTSCWKLMQIIS